MATHFFRIIKISAKHCPRLPLHPSALCVVLYALLLVNVSAVLHAQVRPVGYDNRRPQLSPIGDRIAFESNRDGQMEIYVMNIDGSNETRLTDHPGQDSQPAWSPDGTKIVFVSDRTGKENIFMMRSDGTGLEQLTKDLLGANGPKVSPDGLKIAFKAGAWPKADIFVMDMDGSDLRDLSNSDSYDHSPTWSPDNMVIAFTSNRGDLWEIWKMPADGGTPTRLTNNDYTDEIPAWSPTGEKITYQGRSSGDVQVHVMKVDGSSVTRLTDGPGFNELPAWSSDGSMIYFQSNRDGHWEIYAMQADGSSQSRLTYQPEEWISARIKKRGMSAVVTEMERSLKENPNNDFALNCLKLLISKPFDISRAESSRLRTQVKRYSRHAHINIVPEGEAGAPLKISGLVKDTSGRPVAGVLVYVFHTDSLGLYTPQDGRTGRMDEPNSRLFGYMRTGPDGSYSFRTIRPGGYPKAAGGLSGKRQFIPQHIHLIATAAGYKDHKCNGSTCQLVFEDDPRMTSEWHEWAREMGNPVLKVTTGKDGMLLSEYDIVLMRQ